ncbi:MAG: Omp28-related outer membrane protein [Bacteroidetes bacterium]|nr:Omp28-related outer membrane protein [Bacteroidota bacterium]MBL7105377.1 Omp28-related outer membrane protein [Bacteroidales bacterium]
MKKSILSLLFLVIIFSIKSQTIILDEDFENSSGLPPGWDEITTMLNTYWLVSPVANSHYLIIPYHTKIASLNEGDYDKMLPGEYLVTPPLDLSNFASAFLSVDVFFKAMTFLNKTELATIEASTDGGNTWTTIKNIEGYFNWHKVYADVSDYCGIPGVKFAFKYSDANGWLYGVGIDNVKIFAPYTNDGALQNINKYDFVLINDTVKIIGVVQNFGTNTINSFDINWNVNEGDIFSQSYGSVNLSPLDTFSFIHSFPWIPTTQEPFDVKVWISNINGYPDENPTNDTLHIYVINAVSSIPEKKVLLEVFGATWCSICPHGSDKISEIKDSTENLIVAVVHVDDPFTCAVGTATFENYHLYPGWLVTGLIDRYNYSDDVSMDMDRYLWQHHVYQREADISPVELSLSNNYNPETHDLDIFLTATFRCDLMGDFRFNCYVVEDSLTEEQANCLTIPGREPYCYKDYWIYNPPGIIQNYIHTNVLRDVLGGQWGTEASLPEYVLDGNTYDFQYDYTVPEEFDENNLRIIGIVQKYDSDSSKCEVFNAKDMYLDYFTDSHYIESNKAEFLVYPNPAQDYLFVETKKNNEDIWIEIRNINGKPVLKRKAENNKENIDISGLIRGIYYITIKQNGKIRSEKIVVL